MIKETPSIGRIIAMVAFTLSVFAILIFLWLAFGGSVPLNPEGYRFKVHMTEAATLAQEADVRMAGVNVGKVKTKELDEGGARTIVEVEIDEPYAPIPKDTRAILRAKTLLGETYLELAPGNQVGRHARRRRAAGERPGPADGRARRDLHRLRPRHAPGLP